MKFTQPDQHISRKQEKQIMLPNRCVGFCRPVFNGINRSNNLTNAGMNNSSDAINIFF